MEEKKLTDEEIVKALECCTQEPVCNNCPIKDNDYCSKPTTLFLEIVKLIKSQKAEIERLTECLKDLDWYKMWHKKFKKEIDDLTLELETYRPSKLSGNGQCKCSNCGDVSWTDWFSRYKGKTLCDKCLKEIISTEEKQAVKDTAKEILTDLNEYYYDALDNTDCAARFDFWCRKYGVEVE